MGQWWTGHGIDKALNNLEGVTQQREKDDESMALWIRWVLFASRIVTTSVFSGFRGS